MAVPVPLLTVSSSRRPALAVTAAPIVLVGLTAIIGQIVLLRELIVVFNGNEISLGIILATWLLWTAAGSGLASRFALAQSNAVKRAAVFECALGVSLPMTVWAVPASKAFFQTVPGELVGPWPMLLTCLVCLSVFCVLSGCLFAVVARMYQQQRRVNASRASSSAYLLEGAGSALGGIVASFILLPFLDHFQIAALVALLNLGMAAMLLWGSEPKRIGAIFLVTAALAWGVSMYVAPYVRESSLARSWHGFKLLESRDSIYGNLAVTKTGDIRTIYDNGVIVASAPDEAAAEESVHYALLEHPAPKAVLLIGGGANGSITQVLKHPTVERLDYVELDPALVSMATTFFPAQWASVATDGRVRIHYADGRLYLRTTHDRFDVIVLALPEPQTAQLNRFYTVEFFRSAREHLNPGGLLALQLRASEDYISPVLADFLRCIHRSLQEVFSYISVIPGESMHFFAARQPGVLTEDPQELIARGLARKLETRYVREYFIPFRMMPDRMQQIRQLLQPTAATPANRDFAPIAYYFDVILWSSQFRGSSYAWFREAARFPFWRVLGGILIALLALSLPFAHGLTREKRLSVASACCVAATGFTLMALQLFLLLAFQSIYGYVYHQLAILLGMFMAGIAVGSWIGLHHLRRRDQTLPLAAMAVTQLLLALAGPLLLLFVALLSRVPGAQGTWLLAHIVFPALALLCGMLGGLQFPIATEIYLGQRHKRTGLGMLYAVDLLGGCVGALWLSSYLIPVFGFWRTAWLSVAVNLAAAFLAARATRGPRMSPA